MMWVKYALTSTFTTIIHVSFFNSGFMKPKLKMSAHSIVFEYIKD